VPRPAAPQGTPPIATDHAHWRGGGVTDRLFIIAVLIKGVDGLLGMLGGIILAVVKPAEWDHLAAVLTTHELARDPNDFFANALVHYVNHLSVSTLAFAAGYLFIHGALKTFLFVMLLIGRHWSYPVGIAFLAVFVSYTFYRLTLHWSWILLVFAAFDLFTIFIVFREWRLRHGNWGRASRSRASAAAP
jgi:uncharacterized membrane protein